ncbi:hypothetical protein EUBVEN_00647 [Eubacterium ventriosum ATCC 27560]|uniref:Uncharacterized protein n=1 Tax=Eubacterium ventriosum ATCC 27560 TaxID=411463 RepID=A5Z4M0_9FIRM|nr:hypothetical protein EUBVEN_00647 [Eubacterium ventriosum ATCC 27560]
MYRFAIAKARFRCPRLVAVLRSCSSFTAPPPKDRRPQSTFGKRQTRTILKSSYL